MRSAGCYGYNAFWTDMLPTLQLPPVNKPGTGADDMLWGDGFEIETLINVRVAAAGSTITEDVPDGALAIERGYQKTIENWAGKKLAGRIAKAKKKKEEER